MRQQVVGFCELYMLLMGSWSVMGGSTLPAFDIQEVIDDVLSTIIISSMVGSKLQFSFVACDSNILRQP